MPPRERQCQPDAASHAERRLVRRDLVNHVVGGNVRYGMILDRAEPDVVLRIRDDDWLADDPLAAFDDGLAYWCRPVRLCPAGDTAVHNARGVVT
jgi:hypothetical protein